MKRNKLTIIFLVLLLVFSAQLLQGKMKEGYGYTSWVSDPFLKPSETGIPNSQNCSHRVGNVFLTITNYGFFGAKFWQDPLREEYCTYGSEATPSGMEAPSFEFPAGSGINYLFQGALWFAAIIDEDTLCSVGADGWQWVNEMWPAAVPNGAIERKSSRKGSPYYSPDAISEDDYYATYTDTLTDPQYVAMDPVENRRHIPINIEVNQRSYAWSYKYAEDFILIDFMLRNIGLKTIRRAYMGLYIDADIWAGPTSFDPSGYEDDYSGYKLAVPSPAGGGLEDTINIAWTADNDGNPVGGVFQQQSPVGVAGTRVVRSPNPDLQYSFNWWTSNGYNVNYDWGPMKRDNYRDFGTGGLGTPEKDANKYYILSNNEFDYDQLYAAVDYSSEGWLPPPTADLASNIADGFDTRYLFSFGPFNIEPGDSLLITVAYVAGDNFHIKPDDFSRYFSATNPDAFYDRLDFTDLGVNATWAAWMYDNPGVDTDGDGDSGKYRIKTDTIIDGVDTSFVDRKVYYEGDGVPDFKGPPPPPAPNIRYSAVPGEVSLRWNGLESETYLDDFSQKRDFEGYRVYMGEEVKLDAFALLTSHDLLDYNRFEWDAGRQVWQLRDTPFTPEQLKDMYGQDFNPLDYPESNPYIDNSGNKYYFDKVDWNQYFNDPHGIKKVYMSEIESGEVTADTGQAEFPDNYVTIDGVTYHKYYEYEYTIEGLRPSQFEYFAVTAFDFGNPENGLEPLESSPLSNYVKVYPIYSAENVDSLGIGVSVYPNPYKIDAGYSENGYENPSGRGIEYERRIHFINLPEECVIKIWTTDGDLVREIHHPDQLFSETNSSAYWDLITRNTQAIVSGLYIYSIESDQGTQLGKIVVIK
jgi:hypothetical protein